MPTPSRIRTSGTMTTLCSPEIIVFLPYYSREFYFLPAVRFSSLQAFGRFPPVSLKVLDIYYWESIYFPMLIERKISSCPAAISFFQVRLFFVRAAGTRRKNSIPVLQEKANQFFFQDRSARFLESLDATGANICRPLSPFE